MPSFQSLRELLSGFSFWAELDQPYPFNLSENFYPVSACPIKGVGMVGTAFNPSESFYPVLARHTALDTAHICLSIP
jgi:hypothetical protein